MSKCQDLEPLVTAYLDGEGAPGDRARIEEHLAHCPPCRDQARAESTAREVLRQRGRRLTSSRAPAALHARCAAARVAAPTGVGSRGWTRRPAPYAVAASVLLLAGAGFVFLSGRSATVMAAQLTLDHVKCFEMAGEDGGGADAAALEQTLRDRYGWQIELPEGSPGEELTLLTARRCLYGDGAVAHALYRHRGVPVSVFVVPDRTTAERAVEVMGHEAVMWSKNGRSYVLVSRRPRPQLEQLAAYVRDRVE
jgi:anti-sigma factor RsiW